MHIYIYAHTIQVNTCLILSGSNFLRTTNPLDFNAYTTGMSISVWFRFTGTTSSTNFAGIIGFSNGIDMDDVIISQFHRTNDLLFSIRQAQTPSEFTIAGAFVTGKRMYMRALFEFYPRQVP
jgi:hypothetical protein